MSRIALFSPLSPIQSALVDQIEGLLPHIRSAFDITVVTDGSYKPTNSLFHGDHRSVIPFITYDQFRKQSDSFDLVIYQLGDEGKIHGYMFDALQRYPGLVLLHDLVLHHAIITLTLDRGNPTAYVDEMRYCYGTMGEKLARQVMAGQGEDILTRYPLVDRVIRSSLAMVGYNGYMCNYVQSVATDLPVRRIPYQFHLPEEFDDDFDTVAFRQRLGLADTPVIATLGLFQADKRLSVITRAFRMLLERHPDAVYLLVGAQDSQLLQEKLAAEGLTHQIRPTGWIPPAEFVQYMRITDVAVQLRYPHVGGTPYTPIRLLGMGVPTIISDIEPLAELPADCVVRIRPAAPDEDSVLFAAMDYILSHKKAATQMGQNGKRYVAQHHALSAIIPQYVEFIQEVLERRDELTEQMQVRQRTWLPSVISAMSLTTLAGQALAELDVLPSDNSFIESTGQIIRNLSGGPLCKA
jgi:glycosyltransferase involved in cell wall biosynthesis